MTFANVLFLVVLLITAALAWWLSGFDSKLTGENREDLIRRIVRCGLTLILAGMLLWLPASPAVMPILLVFAAAFFLLWRDCAGELSAQLFHKLIDPEDKRRFDPKQSERYLDTIGALIRSGKKTEAIQLCEWLKASGEADVVALELTLEYLGVPQAAVKKTSPLTEADRLRRQGKFDEAGLLLNSLLAKNPRNVDAALQLTRLYAQDLHDLEKAKAVLDALETQPHVPAGHIQFARRSIHEWSHPQPLPEEVPAPPESIDELLAAKYFGTVIEILEGKIQEQPQDFDLWLKLVEVQASHCGNLKRAEKIVEQMEKSFAFSAGQIQTAKDKLAGWRAAKK